ncbi:hypothetical protein IQ26_06665 [Mesorhizobium tianshanense]|uniref:Uncharacterized protein n=1 Tax=Mesorhizobium tianshanense TaxID=39844 RepID=A0A562MQR7_9HYPH|nr:hypothetical protein IQ26_06665 [Mesorhizobium tianshanense]
MAELSPLRRRMIEDRHSSPRICWRTAPTPASSRCCSKQRQTARQQPEEGRIYYPFHPRCGEAALILRRYAYRGTEFVVIPQPDGSLACIPAWMMREAATHFKLSAEPWFSLRALQSLRAEIDALLGFLQSDSTTEKGQNEAPIRKSPTKPVRSGRAKRFADTRPGDRVGVAGGDPAARDRDGTSKREIVNDQDHG